MKSAKSMKLLFSVGPMSEKIRGIKGRNGEMRKWSEVGTNRLDRTAGVQIGDV